jgi:hypothetical protein
MASSNVIYTAPAAAPATAAAPVYSSYAPSNGVVYSSYPTYTTGATTGTVLPAGTYPAGAVPYTGAAGTYPAGAAVPANGTAVYGQPIPVGQMGPFGPVRGYDNGYAGAGARTGPAPMRVPREVSDRAALWVAKNQWDFTELPHPEGFKFYMTSVLVCASADGVLHENEKSWIVGYAASMGAPIELVRELESAKTAADVERLKARHLGEDFAKFCARTDSRSAASKRGIVYDAIRAASADNDFAVSERQSVVDLAVKLGLTKDDVVALEALNNKEKAVQAEKASLIHRFGV